MPPFYVILKMHSSQPPSLFLPSKRGSKIRLVCQGQRFQGWATQGISLVTKNVQMAGLALLGMLAVPGGAGPQRVARLLAKQ